MILYTLELTGKEPTLEELRAQVANGDFDDIVNFRPFMLYTCDAGMVRVNEDRSIETNTCIDETALATKFLPTGALDDLETLIENKVTEAINAHVQTYHSEVQNG